MSAKSTSVFEYCICGTGEEDVEALYVDRVMPILGMNEASTTFYNSRRQFANLGNNIVTGAGSDSPNHVLVETSGRSQVYCYVCAFMDIKRAGRTNTTCTGCGRGFHTNCFALFHNSIISAMNPNVLQQFFHKLSLPNCNATLALVQHSKTPDMNVPILPRCMAIASLDTNEGNNE
jgi:hypothetical protein